MTWKLASLAACTALAACGGGGSSSGDSSKLQTHAGPVVSTEDFAVRTGYKNFVSRSEMLHLSGQDDTTIPTETIPAQTVTFEAGGIVYTTTTPAQTRPVSGYTTSWSGTVQTSLTPVSAEILLDPHCTSATQVVDIAVKLLRARDGYRTQDGLKIAYTDDFKPVCAFRSDGTHWGWRFSTNLPEIAKVGVLSSVEFTSEPGTCDDATQDDIESRLTGMVTLEPDTIDTAFLSMIYKTMPGRTCSLSTVDLAGQSTEYRVRMSPKGEFLGIEYIRVGPVDQGTDATVIHLSS